MVKKKGLLCILLAMIMCVSCLSGCAFGKKDYTLSEYIDSKDIVIVYQKNLKKSNPVLQNDDKQSYEIVYIFKNNQVYTGHIDSLTFAELSNMTDEEILEHVVSYTSQKKSNNGGIEGIWKDYQFGVETDENGNNTKLEYVIAPRKIQVGSNGNEAMEDYNSVLFKITSTGFAYNGCDIGNSKYLSALEYLERPDNKGNGINTYYFIRDDADITIKADAPKTSGIIVDIEPNIKPQGENYQSKDKIANPKIKW